MHNPARTLLQVVSLPLRPRAETRSIEYVRAAQSGIWRADSAAAPERPTRPAPDLAMLAVLFYRRD
jgi:hypothetical protein